MKRGGKMIQEGRVALVTGGGSGIGREVALSLAKNGVKVAVIDINGDNLIEVMARFKEIGATGMALECDVSDKDDVFRVVETLVERWERIDILVNCAGILYDCFIKNLTEEMWHKVMRINLDSVLYCTQAVMPVMSRQKYGRIVNLSSGAYLGNLGQAAYAVSKAGVVSFTKTAALELARDNVTVNAVAPGLVETPMTAKMPPEAFEKLAKTIPLRRIGKTEDIAHVILMLVSDEAGYTTGQVIHVDGGATTGM